MNHRLKFFLMVSLLLLSSFCLAERALTQEEEKICKKILSESKKWKQLAYPAGLKAKVVLRFSFEDHELSEKLAKMEKKFQKVTCDVQILKKIRDQNYALSNQTTMIYDRKTDMWTIDDPVSGLRFYITYNVLGILVYQYLDREERIYQTGSIFYPKSMAKDPQADDLINWVEFEYYRYHEGLTISIWIDFDKRKIIRIEKQKNYSTALHEDEIKYATNLAKGCVPKFREVIEKYKSDVEIWHIVFSTMDGHPLFGHRLLILDGHVRKDKDYVPQITIDLTERKFYLKN